MAWSKVEWYSLGFNTADKQCYLYYGLKGENVAHQIFVTAPELSALADMFRNEGPITYNSEGHYFVTNQEKVGMSEVLAMALPTIAEGATGPTVRWAQYLLVRRTLSYTQVDGSFGPLTRTAVEQFQRDRHLAVDGIVGPATWAALGGNGAQPPTLAQGSHGPVVEKLQTALNEGRGSFAPGSNPVLAVDGSYGVQTAAAVKGAQQLGGIGADGVVGLQTWALPVHALGQVLANLCGVPGPGGG